MSVRRLAEESVQPASFAFTAENQVWAEKRIGLYPAGRQQSAVIPLLMRAQEQDGWVTRATIEKIAEMLGMPYIRVLEVATFYTQFQLQPVGTRAHIQVCGTTPCMLRGAEGLIEVCKNKIHHEPHHLNEDGTLSWEEVECAGACVNAPMVAIFQDTYEDLTPERLEEIIDAFHAGRADTIKPGTQIDRLNAAPASGLVVLTEEPTAKREKFVPPPAPDAPAAVPAAGAAPQAPTTAAQPKNIAPEAAPALKGAPVEAKVSTAQAEKDRKDAAVSAGADGKPNTAMREGATGAESSAGKVDGGKGVGSDNEPAVVAASANPKEVTPNAEKGGVMPLFVAPSGAADDLKLISGVGPVIESKLNALGVTRYDQVAAFSDEDFAKVEAALSFPGRAQRDNWKGQAEALAKGGIEEYRRVFGKDPR
ncbi:MULTISPECIES: NADH-quinone oxidoreductase subunit NuoE [unclassified Devosia]|uniref:NADH-quinone oxidoreductase subunit NuoE n=1 Tax=unclassified Devosia TaxID=196773 RepID=UPI00145EF8AC|nr:MULTISPECIES: NADH-quinone oxidoreductase subunit NuoE [unclassified Devosia]MBJ6986365.1 NADH-quinone oxidoreductase subunit NuoE [Devosia sp. MC521]QMW64159.1 NADH-quinone oxidoreductase subunit NuoE [Devosia sp. MC521]